MLKMRLTTLSGLFFALAITCAYSQQKPSSPKPPPALEPESRQEQMAPGRGTEQAPFVIQLIPPPKAQAKGETEAPTNKPTDWSSILLTIFNGLLVVCTALLFAIARSQRNDLRAIQRAYISAEPGGLHPLWGEKREEHWVIGHVKFRNGGRMPARNFRWYATIACDENSLREEFPIPSVSEFEGTTIIAPGSAMKFGTKELKLPESGWIYVWGAYTYDDGFDADQFARFCHRYNRKALRKEMDKSDPDSGHGIPADDGRLHRFGNSRERPPTSRSEPSPPQTPSETS
jgi:hypothetical protein